MINWGSDWPVAMMDAGIGSYIYTNSSKPNSNCFEPLLTM